MTAEHQQFGLGGRLIVPQRGALTPTQSAASDGCRLGDGDEAALRLMKCWQRRGAEHWGDSAALMTFLTGSDEESDAPEGDPTLLRKYEALMNASKTLYL